MDIRAADVTRKSLAMPHDFHGFANQESGGRNADLEARIARANDA
jgi:hypothetical protein